MIIILRYNLVNATSTIYIATELRKSFAEDQKSHVVHYIYPHSVDTTILSVLQNST